MTGAYSCWLTFPCVPPPPLFFRPRARIKTSGRGWASSDRDVGWPRSRPRSKKGERWRRRLVDEPEDFKVGDRDREQRRSRPVCGDGEREEELAEGDHCNRIMVVVRTRDVDSLLAFQINQEDLLGRTYYLIRRRVPKPARPVEAQVVAECTLNATRCYLL